MKPKSTAWSTFRNKCCAGTSVSIDTSSNSCCCNSGFFSMKSKYKRLPSKTRAFLGTFVSSLRYEVPQTADEPHHFGGFRFCAWISCSDGDGSFECVVSLQQGRYRRIA